MGKLHFLQRLGRELGWTKKTHKGISEETTNSLGTIVSRNYDGVRFVWEIDLDGTSPKRTIKYEDKVDYWHFQPGSRVKVRIGSLYDIVKDYVGNDFSQKVEIGRTLVSTQVLGIESAPRTSLYSFR